MGFFEYLIACVYLCELKSSERLKTIDQSDSVFSFQHGMALELEPKGIIFTEIRFMNHRVERRAKLQRNRKIFRQKGNINKVGYVFSMVVVSILLHAEFHHEPNDHREDATHFTSYRSIKIFC